MDDGTVDAHDMQMLWRNLERVRHSPRGDESVLERLQADPWEHDDPAVREAWNALTRPEHLSGLRAWWRPDMNRTALRFTEKAIEDAQARSADGA
jgi:hypothetical protein